MLLQRLLTALVLLPAALAVIFWLLLQWFVFAVALVIALGAWEWAPLMGMSSKKSRFSYAILLGLLMAVLAWQVPADAIWQQGKLAELFWYCLLIGGVWWLIASILVLAYPRGHSFWQQNKLLLALFGVLTLIPAWVAFISLRAVDYSQNELFGGFLTLFACALVWAADVGAYFVGVYFGKRKLLPAVSPGKTLEGCAGGFVLALVVMALVAHFYLPAGSPLVPLLVIGLITVAASVLGDLTESMFKRSAGVKDSGSILPGHGGILDRIDSLTAAVPIFALGYVGWLVNTL